MKIQKGMASAFMLLSLTACGSVPGLAPPAGSPEATAASSTLTVADQAFLTQAAYGGLSEVILGRMAAEQAATPAVRQFARQMVEEHSAINEELVALAEAKDMTPPVSPDAGREAAAAGLEMLEGTNFDRQYLQQQLTEHEVAIALYRTQAQGGTDPDVRAFAAKWLPRLQDHAAMIRSMMGMR
ncbi:DUF4142 domain-containing protein [Telmatospirillum sp. J64-1]|uniref:DUF4142 domain-containing protein n=1 Tax=Telmatospirillum sp. J64-1 TaxID=2502183 RepID=UPI00115E981C|nr:DUF4142 domain-containing protein [Telmatospirillum sp. J64-1]